jgi:hypothetical protein
MLKEHVEPEWVDYPTAERYSGLSHVSLWRRVKNGELKAARVGRSVTAAVIIVEPPHGSRNARRMPSHPPR